MTKTVQAVVVTYCGCLYHGNWCADTFCTLLCVCDLKAAQMDRQCSLIQELMRLNWAITPWKKPKTLAVRKVKVLLITVTSWFKKFCLGYKNLDNQVRSGRPKSVASKAILQAIDGN